MITKSLAMVAATLVVAAIPSHAIGPVFQGLDNDLLVVVEPDRLLSVAVPIRPDQGSAYYTGIAHDPTSGKVFVASVKFGMMTSFLAEVDFTTGALHTLGTIEGEWINEIAFDGSGQLYALTDNKLGRTPHALLTVDKVTGRTTVAAVLDTHGAPTNSLAVGAIAWNPADGSVYYTDRGSDGLFFVDRLAPGTFAQTAVTKGRTGSPLGMAFTQGRLWIATTSFLLSADVNDYPSGFRFEQSAAFPTPAGQQSLFPSAFFPITLSCVPSATAACLYNRFRVEVTYDARPQSGTGSANVVLESAQTVKFTFFDPANIEVILKILDACSPPFSKWWIFAGGLTNVGVMIKVTDTRTGAVRTYSNPKGKLFQPVSDTRAFDCP